MEKLPKYKLIHEYRIRDLCDSINDAFKLGYKPINNFALSKEKEYYYILLELQDNLQEENDKLKQLLLAYESLPDIGIKFLQAKSTFLQNAQKLDAADDGSL